MACLFVWLGWGERGGGGGEVVMENQMEEGGGRERIRYFPCSYHYKPRVDEVRKSDEYQFLSHWYDSTWKNIGTRAQVCRSRGGHLNH